MRCLRSSVCVYFSALRSDFLRLGVSGTSVFVFEVFPIERFPVVVVVLFVFGFPSILEVLCFCVKLYRAAYMWFWCV